MKTATAYKHIPIRRFKVEDWDVRLENNQYVAVFVLMDSRGDRWHYVERKPVGECLLAMPDMFIIKNGKRVNRVLFSCVWDSIIRVRPPLHEIIWKLTKIMESSEIKALLRECSICEGCSDRLASTLKSIIKEASN